MMPAATPRWSRTTRRIVLVVVAVLAAAFLWRIQDLFGPLVLAGLLTYLLHPLVDFGVARLKLRRALSATLVFAGTLALVAVLAVWLVPRAAAQLTASTAELQPVLVRLEQELAALSGVDVGLSANEVSADVERRLQESLNIENLVSLIQRATTNVSWALVTLVSAYYLLLDWGRLRDWLIALAPGALQVDLRRLYVDVRRVWQRYLKGQVFLMLVVGGLSAVGGLVVGLPGAAVLGTVAGVLDIIPTFGPGLAMAFATAVGAAAGSLHLDLPNAWFAALVLAIYAGVQLIENLWLRPMIIGYSVRLHPGVVFVAFFSALTMSGILLALLIVPLLGTVAVLGRYVRSRMLGLPAWPDEAVPVQPPLIEP